MHLVCPPPNKHIHSSHFHYFAFIWFLCRLNVPLFYFPFFFALFLSFCPLPFFLPHVSLCIPACPPSLIRSLSTELHVSESIRAESRRGRSFTEVNIKLHQAPRRKRGEERRGEREPSVPNPPHRSGGDEGNILFWQDTILRRAPLSPAIDFFFLSFFFSSLFSPSASGTEFVCYCVCVCLIQSVRACVPHAFVWCCRASFSVCMCTGVWMGDNRNSIRKCVEETRMVQLVGVRLYKQAAVWTAKSLLIDGSLRRMWEPHVV